MKLGVLLALPILVIGCSSKNKPPVKPPVKIVGMSKDIFLACAGAPTKSTKSNDVEVLTYTYTAAQPQTASGPAQKIQCSARFVFQRDVITSFNYSALIGGIATQSQHCSSIVAKCTKQ